ncbi:hypothetical protein B0H16DRAFT_279829 [Mycena metata]|uniref:Uncharacterized protein n=1 Tax=Mycena metata TaxID=1033252 RepID=A0AAD7HR96_9AGAR|nr:hypothetical protein B0H16DRAFT_279829 [Mycena metata]
MLAPSKFLTDTSSLSATDTSTSSTRVLDAVLPALQLAKASASGIGLPGVEPMIGAILELATMVSTMQANEDDLYKLERCLTALIAINPSGGGEDLRLRLSSFTSSLEVLAAKCQSLSGNSQLYRIPYPELYLLQSYFPRQSRGRYGLPS